MTFRAGRLRFSFGYFAAACLCLCAAAFGDKFPASVLCVALHEMGHIFFLLHYNRETIDITIRCMSIDIIDKKQLMRGDRQHALVTAAGPLMNLLTAPLFFALYRACGASFFQQCAKISAALAAFNLLPAVGTDGGMLLSLLLEKHFSPRTATVTLGTLTVIFLTPLCAAAFYILLCSRSNFTLLLAAMAIIYSALESLCEKSEKKI